MCPRESEIIRLVAGELPEPEAAQLRQHIAGCEACQRMMARHRSVWESLGDADQTPVARDLTAAILAAASRPANSSSSLRRIAAAVLLAIGAGVVVGTATPVRTPPSATAAADADAAIDALGVDALVMDQTGLSAALSLPVPTTASDEERS